MKLQRLNKEVLKLWHLRWGIAALALAGLIVSIPLLLESAGAPWELRCLILWISELPLGLLTVFFLIYPRLRHRYYRWGRDDRTVEVQWGVIARRRVVIPVCQIQDLHRVSGPLMRLWGLGSVTVSTAGSNFTLPTLTAQEADGLMDDLERLLEARIKERNDEALC